MNKILLYMGMINSSAGITLCSAASDENIEKLSFRQPDLVLREHLSDNLIIDRANEYLVKLSKPLSESIDLYAFKINKDGSFEDIWGREYPTGCRIEGNRIVYPNGDWLDMEYTLFEHFDDNGHIDYYGVEKEAMMHYIGTQKEDQYGRIAKEDKDAFYYETDYSFYKKNQNKYHQDDSCKENE